MKAWILQSNGQIEYNDTEIPEINENEVLVEVKAAGICGSDIPRIYNNGAYFYPLITGHEFSGKVVKVGLTENELWYGKRVGVFPLIPCKKCEPCKQKAYEMCRKYGYLGSRQNGGFAEFVAVPTENLIELPDNVSYEVAAMLEPMAVAVHSIRQIDLKVNDKIVICGLGTIGIFVLMFLTEMGMKNIYVIGNKDFQKKTVLAMGITEDNYCDSKKIDVNKWLSEKSEGLGFDVFFECVGKNETVSEAVDNTAPGGKIVLVGNPHSGMEFDKKTYWKILRNQLTLHGTWNSSFIHDADDDWHYVLDKISQKKIYPENLITHKLDMNDFEKGLHIMRDKSEDFIKVMMCKK